jgi:hypothetical protein
MAADQRHPLDVIAEFSREQTFAPDKPSYAWR